MYLVDTPNGRHCTRHDVDVERGEVCHQCVTDPADAPGSVEVDEAEVSALRGRISEYRSNSRSCSGESKRLRDEGTVQEGNLAVKWTDCAIKWARLAEEQQSKLDEYTRDDRLVRKAERLAGVGV